MRETWLVQHESHLGGDMCYIRLRDWSCVAPSASIVPWQSLMGPSKQWIDEPALKCTGFTAEDVANESRELWTQQVRAAALRRHCQSRYARL